MIKQTSVRYLFKSIIEKLPVSMVENGRTIKDKNLRQYTHAMLGVISAEMESIIKQLPEEKPNKKVNLTTLKQYEDAVECTQTGVVMRAGVPVAFSGGGDLNKLEDAPLSLEMGIEFKMLNKNGVKENVFINLSETSPLISLEGIQDLMSMVREDVQSKMGSSAKYTISFNRVEG
jgi:hypothetical protein